MLGNVYISDSFNNRIRKVTVSTGIITTIAGSSTSGSYSGDNGPATSAMLYYPIGIALDSVGTHSSILFELSIFPNSSLLQVTCTSRINQIIVSAK